MPLYLQNEGYYLKCHCHHIIIFLNSFLHQTSIYKIHKCCFLLLIEYNNNDAILYWQRVAFLHVAALNFFIYYNEVLHWKKMLSSPFCYCIAYPKCRTSKLGRITPLAPSLYWWEGISKWDDLRPFILINNPSMWL